MINGVKNRPMRRRYVQIWKDMLGKSEHVAQGKPTMKQSNPMDVRNQLVELLPTIKIHYSDVEMAEDALHENWMPFLSSVSNRMHWGTVNVVDNMKCDTLEKGLQNIISLHAANDFNVFIVILDMTNSLKIGTIWVC